MNKKPIKKLRLHKENLKTLNTDHLVRVHAGAQGVIIAPDPWDPTFSCTIA